MKFNILRIIFCVTLLGMSSHVQAQEPSLKKLKDDFKNAATSSESRTVAAINLAEYFFDRDMLDSTRYYVSAISGSTLENELYPVIGKKIDAKILYKEGEYQEAIAILDTVTPILIASNNTKHIVDALVYQSVCYSIIGESAQSNKTLKTAETYATEPFLQSVYNSFAQNYIDQDDIPRALQYLNDAIQLGEKYNDDFEQAISYQTYAYLNLQQKDFNKSIEYYEKARVYYEKINYPRGLFLVNINIANAAAELGLNEEARVGYNKAFELSKEIKNEYATAAILGSLAEVEYRSNNLVVAEDQYKQALVIFNKLGILDLSSEISMKLATLYNDQNRFVEAQKYAKESVRLSDSTDLWAPKKNSRKVLSDIYRKQGNFKAASDLQIIVAKFTDSLNNTLRSKEIETQRANFEVVQKEQDLKLSEQNIISLKEKQRLNTYIYVLGGLGLLLLLTLVYRQLKLTQTKKKVLETENELSELKQKQLEDTVHQKSGQVINFALHIKEKNELLAELKKKVSAVRKATNDTETKSNLQNIIISLTNAITINQNRVKLISDVDSTNEEFLSNLSSQFPDLTEREKNIAGLIRANMSSKQIAENLNITVMSLNNVRSKIRRKMNAPKGTNLSQFLKKI